MPGGTPFARLRGLQSTRRFTALEPTPFVKQEVRGALTRIQAFDPSTGVALQGWVATDAIELSPAPRRPWLCGTGLHFEMVTRGLWLYDRPHGEPVARSYATFV